MDNKRILADISPEKHNQVKAKAAAQGLKIKQLLEKLLDEWLKKPVKK